MGFSVHVQAVTLRFAKQTVQVPEQSSLHRGASGTDSENACASASVMSSMFRASMRSAGSNSASTGAGLSLIKSRFAGSNSSSNSELMLSFAGARHLLHVSDTVAVSVADTKTVLSVLNSSTGPLTSQKWWRSVCISPSSIVASLLAPSRAVKRLDTLKIIFRVSMRTPKTASQTGQFWTRTSENSTSEPCSVQRESQFRRSAIDRDLRRVKHREMRMTCHGAELVALRVGHYVPLVFAV